MLIFKLDPSLFDGWNPPHTFIQKLSRRMAIEIGDFYLGLETGLFKRKERKYYQGRTVTKDMMRKVLYSKGVKEDSFLESESFGSRRLLESYASKAGLRLSALMTLSEDGDEEPGPIFTEVTSEREDDDYYESALDAAVLVFIYATLTNPFSVAYLEGGCGKSGWNPTLQSLNNIAERSGLSLEALSSYAKPDGGIVTVDLSGGGYEEITKDDVVEALYSLFGTDEIRRIAGSGDYILSYQHLRRKGPKTMTIMILLGYLKKLGMTLPDFFRLCKERKG